MDPIESQNQNIIQPPKPQKKFKSSGFLRFFELSRVIMLIIMLIYIVYLFIFTLFVVSGPSMEPNFHDKDVLIVNKAAYWFSEPKRGDAIIFYFPGEENVKYIKRIIGIPGDTIEIKDHHFYVNGAYLQDYTPTTYSTDVLIEGKDHWVVGDNQYFVSGDNRPNSNDSRVWDPLGKSEIIGKVDLRLYPFNQFGRVK